MIGIVGHFNTTFAPKTEHVFFNLLHQNAVDIQKGPFYRLTSPSSVIWLLRISSGIYIDDVTSGTKCMTLLDVYIRPWQ